MGHPGWWLGQGERSSLRSIPTLSVRLKGWGTQCFFVIERLGSPTHRGEAAMNGAPGMVAGSRRAVELALDTPPFR